ncbi:ABC-three component system middle component 8 [Burkholderia pyrrocinia]|uniref:ABC-three component system middle component 8 n=1 Tax=Burkholderia pyrrocinia TaxID=60550 RepID=UPI001F459C21|nr:ABC-three component system middle component 8 [Burkholderia pyrrocinia]
MSLLLLARLKTRRLDEYDVLKKFAKKSVVGGDVLFLPALNFLYLMGLIEYRPKTDAIEYVGPNEAV